MQDRTRSLLSTSNDDRWIHTIDNEFAQGFFSRLAKLNELPRFSGSTALCRRCNTISLDKPLTVQVLRRKLSPCFFCRLQPRLSRAVEERVRFLSAPSLRLCAAPKTKNPHPEIQVGYPVLSPPDSLARFDLFREWLRVCDEDHAACNQGGSMADLPTRVIDIGEEATGDLRLHTFSAEEKDNSETNYLALSHCWGGLSEKQKRKFCTTKENLEERLEDGFDFGSLPSTFRDAITVTRRLGKRYLWIDALCIVQFDDERDDWKREVNKMEAVFRNAYCTIAATSAKDATSGFLRQVATAPKHPEQQFIRLNTESHGRIYVSATTDDFYQDVERADLNQRAWALQERALARRTIHFSANQAYFECGDGVRCETLTRLHGSRMPFLGDPYFPRYQSLQKSSDEVKLFQSLFERYSRLGITESTDRPLAAFGLEQRMAAAFATTSRYGVFERYLHRSLLWRRADAARMSRIRYPEGEGVPSWSWMAYDGRIEYLGIGAEEVEWSDDVFLADDGALLRAPVRRFKNCATIRDGASDYRVVDIEGRPTPGWLSLDGKRRFHAKQQKCVVIGRQESAPPPRPRAGRPAPEENWNLFILIVSPDRTDEGKAYKRVGIGCIPSDCISLRGKPADEMIV